MVDKPGDAIEPDWDEEFADDPEWAAMTPEQRQRLLEFVDKAIEKKVFCVYGDEEEGIPDSDWPCNQYLPACEAKCCTYVFALTQSEVETGIVRYNKDAPFMIERNPEDGYCPHFDKQNFRCEIYDNRPLRCRRYDCRNDTDVWPDGLPEKS